LAVIDSDGTVWYIPPATIVVDCMSDSNSTYTCPMKFGSWVYDGYKLDLYFYNENEEVDMNDYVERDWRVVSNFAQKNIKFYPCCEEAYPDLSYIVGFQRNTNKW
jgi:hypothetical protein